MSKLEVKENDSPTKATVKSVSEGAFVGLALMGAIGIVVDAVKGIKELKS